MCPQTAGIEPLRASHLEALVALERRAFAGPAPRSWPRSSLEAALRGRHYWCRGLWVGETLSAFFIGRILVDEAEVLHLGVCPERRRSGLASRLLDDFIAALHRQSLKHLFLEVAVDNETALNFYRQRQFVPIGRRPKYYAGVEGLIDALVLCRELS